MVKKIGERPQFERGDQVEVREVNLKPWIGEVRTIKPSSVSGWWMDVALEDGQTWSLCMATEGMEIVAVAKP